MFVNWINVHYYGRYVNLEIRGTRQSSTRKSRRRASKPFDPRDLATEHPEVVAAIKTFKPTAIIGVSTKGGLFSPEVVEALSQLNERPIIFALSNPTRKAECTAEQAYTWSKGKALYAAGVQFPDVQFEGQTFHPGQANNFYVYPAIGLATYVARPKRLTDQCFIVAAQATADQVDPDSRAKGRLYPVQSNILETEISTATRVAEYLFDQGTRPSEATQRCARLDREAALRAGIRRKRKVTLTGR